MTSMRLMAAVAPRLVFLFGPRRGVTLELMHPLTVGRSADCHLHLLDEKVSREHCRFELHQGEPTVIDLNSRNGTWVNGERVTGARPLLEGDTVGIGETLVLVSPSANALRTKDGESTLVLETGALGLTTSAARPDDDVLARAGRLLLQAMLAPGAAAAAERLTLAFAQGLDADETLLCTRTSEGALRPLLAHPKGAALHVNAALVEQAERQQRAVCVELAQLRAKADEHTTTALRQRAFVVCAPLPEGRGVFIASRSRTFDSPELALAQALAAGAALALPVVSVAPHDATATLIAESRAMRSLVEQATRAAASVATVLLTGESGSGKEALARLVHAKSRRAGGPFVALNCGAVPASLAESELFGHEKGAFTGATVSYAGVFERADGGTLLLDEVGELPLGLQVKLLRVLEEKLVWRVGARTPVAIDVRIVAATNRSLEQAVSNGTFREDLFYRLNVIRLEVPPLRERADDVLPLARLWLTRHAAELGRPTPLLSDEAARALLEYSWPGNVRQLGNALVRALVLKDDAGPVTLADLPAEVVAPTMASSSTAAHASRSLAQLVETLEREQIVLAMKRARGVKVQACQLLGISRPTLDRKLADYGIDWLDP